MPTKTDYDAIVVGSGPNGLSAAIALQQAELSVLVIEGRETIGGGMRSAELTLPHFIHDICSAVHPLAAASSFFKTLPLQKHGLEFIYPPVHAAHPFDDGGAAALYTSIDKTAEGLGSDAEVYRRLLTPFVNHWPEITNDILAPLHFPKHFTATARFGLTGIRSAVHLVKRFQRKEARGLWAGMAAHSMQPLSNFATAAIGLLFTAAGHTGGWPVAKGGSISIANALASYFISLGGTIQTDFYVSSLSQLPTSRAILFDVTPRQLLQIAGQNFSELYQWQLKRYRYGTGVFKIDWALRAPIPFVAPACTKAGTIHLGNSFEEIADAEKLTAQGKHPEKPFVLLAQQSLFDASRVPEGAQAAWAYCHVPQGSTRDMTAEIENQVERFAPGFRELIAARHIMNSAELEAYNPNYVGGDISGGMMNWAQLFTRPALRFSPYRTSAKGIYICSSSTPPGAGVHGLCGYFAAKRALKDIFKKNSGANQIQMV